MSARKTRLLIKVSDFYWGLHGKGLKKGGGTLFTSDGEFNSAGCMDSLFAPVNGSMSKSNATAMVRLRLCVHRFQLASFVAVMGRAQSADVPVLPHLAARTT
jgi:hypothetical protein